MFKASVLTKLFLYKKECIYQPNHEDDLNFFKRPISKTTPSFLQSLHVKQKFPISLNTFILWVVIPNSYSVEKESPCHLTWWYGWSLKIAYFANNAGNSQDISFQTHTRITSTILFFVEKKFCLLKFWKLVKSRKKIEVKKISFINFQLISFGNFNLYLENFHNNEGWKKKRNLNI